MSLTSYRAAPSRVTILATIAHRSPELPCPDYRLSFASTAAGYSIPRQPAEIRTCIRASDKKSGPMAAFETCEWVYP